MLTRIAGVCAAIVAVLVLGASILAVPLGPRLSSMPPADVEVLTPGAHGSAVHIGNGFFLTAEHVTEKNKTVELVSGSAQQDARVLWTNPDFDIALISGPATWVQARPLSCTPLEVGDAILGHGNPYDMGQVTVRGIVAAKAKSANGWRSMHYVDATFLPGMSGGGVEADGWTVGIITGVRLSEFPPSPTGFGVVVPGDAICMVLGRQQAQLPTPAETAAAPAN